jgi:acyl dehydratase
MWWHHVDVDAAPTGVFGGRRSQSLDGLCRCRAVCRVLLERCSEGTRLLIGEILVELCLRDLRLRHLLLLSQ